MRPGDAAELVVSILHVNLGVDGSAAQLNRSVGHLRRGYSRGYTVLWD